MLDLALRSAMTLLEPVGFTWACLLVLTVLLLRKKEFRLAAVPAALAVLIWIIGATPVPGRLLASLESPWVGMKRADLPEADVIVLLGGYSTPSREEVGGLHFNGSADRAVTALELVRLGKAKTLVVSGSALTVNGEAFHVMKMQMRDGIEHDGNGAKVFGEVLIPLFARHEIELNGRHGLMKLNEEACINFASTQNLTGFTWHAAGMIFAHPLEVVWIVSVSFKLAGVP